jgi:hypothetical protein
MARPCHRHGIAALINGAGCIATMQAIVHHVLVSCLLFGVASERENMQSKDDRFMQPNLCLFLGGMS